MKIAVIGDIIIDHYLSGECKRISPEAPTPILDLKKEWYSLGGAANLAKNLTALGEEVTLFSIFGNNGHRNTILDSAALLGIKIIFIEEDRKFSVKTRIMSQSQQLLRYDDEDCFEISKNSVEYFKQAFLYEFAETNFDCVIISDYNKGMISDNLLKELYEICNLLHIKIFVDPKQNIKKYENCFLISPNITEANQLFKINIQSKNDVVLNKDHILRIMKIYNISNVVITLGAEGAYLINESTSYHFSLLKKIQVYDVTGAGDTFLAALVFDYLRNKDLHIAIPFANIAASLSVQKSGTTAVTAYEIHQSMSKFFEINNLKNYIQHLKDVGKKVVFTNGVFDILHPGHLHLIKTAKSYGDYLIVAINSDESVRRIKGNSRPIFSTRQRGMMLASLEDVDCVITFTEDTPYEVLEILKPNVLVKGADYQIENIIGRQFVDETILVDLKTTDSTSKIIQQIQDEI